MAPDCIKIYLHAIYGSALWELGNNNDFDYKDIKKVVTFNTKMGIR